MPGQQFVGLLAKLRETAGLFEDVFNISAMRVEMAEIQLQGLLDACLAKNAKSPSPSRQKAPLRTKAAAVPAGSRLGPFRQPVEVWNGNALHLPGLKLHKSAGVRSSLGQIDACAQSVC